MPVHPPAAAESSRWDRVSNVRHSGSHSTVHATRPASSGSHAPTVVETGEELILFVDMIVIGATIMPGFLLCVPALVLHHRPCCRDRAPGSRRGLAILLVTAPVRLGWRVARRLRHALAAVPPRSSRPAT